MKTIENNRILKETGTITSYEFSVHKDDRVHLFKILRNQTYSDKILAVIREYSTNAYDAHVVAGIKDTPIRVGIPNSLFPEFRVRDYGHGLSEEDMQNIYTSYGRSSKRGNNYTVGQLGIGSKSAFCYGDNFLITSYHGGKKTVYNAVIDETELGKVSKIHQEDMSPTDKTGGEIVVPVMACDFAAFKHKAYEFFEHWDVLPEFTGIGSPFDYKQKKVVLKTDSWTIYEDTNYVYNNKLVALMGNVKYPINFNILDQKHVDPSYVENHQFLNGFLSRNRNALIIKFAIGDLEISSSRESLQYTDYTIRNIQIKLNDVIAHIRSTLIDLFASKPDIWSAKCLYYEMFEEYGQKFSGYQKMIGVINYKGTVIDKSSFEHSERWCNIHGYIDDVQANNLFGIQYDPVVTRYYTPSTDKWTIHKSNYRNSEYMAVRSNYMIMINDIKKPSLIKSCINKLIEKHSLQISTVYLCKFNSDELYNKFIKHYNMENMNFMRLSEVYDEVNAAKKRKRNTPSELTSVKIQDITRSNRRSSAFEEDTQIDLAEASGYYVPMFDGQIVEYESDGTYYNKYYYDLKEMIDTINQHFPYKLSIDHNVIYGFNKRITEMKYFKNNSSNWTNIFDKIREIVNNEITDEYLKYKVYFFFSDKLGYTIDPHTCKNICSLIDDKSSNMYKILDNISKFDSEFYKILFRVERMIGRTTSAGQYDKLYSDANKMYDEYNEMMKKYPLMTRLSFYPDIFRNGVNKGNKDLKVFTDYINLVDKSNP